MLRELEGWPNCWNFACRMWENTHQVLLARFLSNCYSFWIFSSVEESEWQWLLWRYWWWSLQERCEEKYFAYCWPFYRKNHLHQKRAFLIYPKEGCIQKESLMFWIDLHLFELVEYINKMQTRFQNFLSIQINLWEGKSIKKLSISWWIHSFIIHCSWQVRDAFLWRRPLLWRPLQKS